MLTKNRSKIIQSLDKKKFRQKYGIFVVEGYKNVVESWKSSLKCNEIFCTESFTNFPNTLISPNEMKQISHLKNPSSVLGVFHLPEKEEFKASKNEWVIALDRIQDPGNFGTIIRLADWFGIKKIICSTDTADVYQPKVIQASMGSYTRVQVFYENLSEVFKTQTAAVYAADMNGKNIYTKDFNDSGFLLMGNEGQGISNELTPFIQAKICIPSFGDGQVESLNVATATAIILGEIFGRAFK